MTRRLEEPVVTRGDVVSLLAWAPAILVVLCVIVPAFLTALMSR